jgi:hypothetical protein
MARVIRWAKVEYQPNLERPVAPVPLGVVVEETGPQWRHILILGREPRRAVPELQIEDAWGPFLQTVTGWVEAVAKSMRDSLNEATPQQSVVDLIAHKWRGNLYLQQPDNNKAVESVLLETVARHLYTGYVGAKFPLLPREREARRRAARRVPPIPWISSQHSLQAAG